MSNPNPFLPKGSLLEQQSKRRSRLKVAVLCTVSVGVVGLVAMLIQGCKRDTSMDLQSPDATQTTQTDTNNVNPPIDTNSSPMTTGTSSVPTNEVSAVPPVSPLPPVNPPQQPLPPVTPPATADATGGSTYTILKGDTLGKIAKKNGVSLSALEAANPGVDSKHLRVGKTVVIPAGGTAVSATTGSSIAAPDATDTASGTSYTVKSGDVLYKIAKKFHVTVKAIKSANHLTTNNIKVGQKLKIPAKAEKAPVAPAAPIPDVAPNAPANTAPAPLAPPVSTVPAPAPAPAPGN